MAFMHSLKFLAVASLTLTAALSAAQGQQRTANLFTVGNVRAEATGENAVEAKKLATQSAETSALRRLLIKLTDFRSHSRLPEIAPEEIEQFVSNIEVRNEGFSGTTYVATFGVTFSERAVRSLMARSGLTPVEERGPEILILPVFIDGGAARTTDRNPWRNALAQTDLANGLVPAKLAPTRGDITAAIAKAYLASPKASIDTLKTQYRTSLVMMAVAEIDGNGEAINLKLLGVDALGPFSLQRKLRSNNGVDEGLMQLAARLAVSTVEQRWKLTRNLVLARSDADTGGVSSSAGTGFSTFSGGATPVQVTAQYSGLKEWQAIRGRLQNLPGVQNFDTKSVDPRSASVTFDFPGGAERLASIAAAQGLSVESGPEGWVVKTR